MLRKEDFKNATNLGQIEPTLSADGQFYEFTIPREMQPRWMRRKLRKLYAKYGDQQMPMDYEPLEGGGLMLKFP